MTSKNSGCLAALFGIFARPSASRPANQPSSSNSVVLPAARTVEPVPAIFPYRTRDDFLSPSEASFYHVLKSMVGERMVIFSQVSLAGIFFVAPGDGYQTFQNKIDRKRVDFLLCDPKTLKPVLGIELDDASHRRPDRQERDAFVEKVFADAKLPLARVPVRMNYDVRELGALFQQTMKSQTTQLATGSNKETSIPTCPKCGVPMVRRVAKRGNMPGQQFWGCSNYPRCREMVADSASTG
jgi:ribosomal protein L37AE/L43A